MSALIPLPGSITLDAHRLAAALMEEIEPLLAAHLRPTPTPTLTPEDAVTVLSGHLPHQLSHISHSIAIDLQASLARAGYTLVRLADLDAPAAPAPTRREKEDTWFDPNRTD